MGVPDGKDASAFDSLDNLLHRLLDMVTGHGHAADHAAAETVEEAVRRIEDCVGKPAKDI